MGATMCYEAARGVAAGLRRVRNRQLIGSTRPKAAAPRFVITVRRDRWGPSRRVIQTLPLQECSALFPARGRRD